MEKNHYGKNRLFRKSFITQNTFSRELWLYGGMDKHFSVVYETPTLQVKSTLLKGVSQPSFYSKVGGVVEVLNAFDSIPVLYNWENGAYRVLISDDIAVLQYFKFGSATDSVYINKAFADAEKKGVSRFVLDLRGNIGGTTKVYDAFFAHLTQDSIPYFSRVEYKVSKELLDRKPYGNRFKYPDEANIGKQCELNANSLRYSPKKSPLYLGRFYVLCDEGTFSTASAFCAIVQDNKLGKLIGRATGGMGSSFGNFLVFMLPNSKIPLLVSSARYYRPNGDREFTPVIPDVFVDDCDLLNFFNKCK
ncbi:Peptidase family S41 [Williamwhitmania taraxaci]|uniref:Peptidase family S41 n=2 Tax=Williamwhitmania taraxaci TaxID=1640674 RepID=A0A1G6PJW0_9BACT|nr:Peptidase family S41 [Williamwhitmania taraxaci]